jgi:putative membrane protein
MRCEIEFRRSRARHVSRSDSPSGERHRLHPVAALTATLRRLGALLPVFVVALISGRRDEGSFIAHGIWIVALLLSVVVGIGGWLRFRYWIEGDELRVEQGLFVRRRTFVPRERIVAMDESASVFERIFGLVRLRITTAAAGTEVELSAIRHDESERLQRLLSSHRDGETGSTGRAAPDARYALGTTELLLAASTSGRLGVLLSGIGWLISQLDELVFPWLQQRLIGVTRTSLPTPPMIAIFALATLMLSWLVSVAVETVRYGGFNVERHGDDLIVRRGWLERREIVIARSRVQAIVLLEGMLRQPLGYATVIVESAGHAEDKGRSTVLHPFLHRSEWHTFLEQIAPDHAALLRLERPPRRALIRFLLRPMLVSAGAALIASVFVPAALVLLGLVLPAAWLGALRFRDTGAGVSGRVLVVQSRNFRRRTAFVRKAAVQHAELASSLLQRRRRLSTFEIGVASGMGGIVIGARDLDSGVVRELLEWSSPRQTDL